ncbi:MAG TPA: hypothetical protein VJR02_26710 [Pyrinomonadaceae bacterium]|nr:hypothetical protein [Pyrinomonadaceae bacterium]
MIEFAAASESISQVEAWKLWLENVDISTKVIMFDISVRNWGRIGKSIQAFAALAILLDIIGAPALRRFGKSLRNLITLGRARYLAVLSLQIVGDGIFPKNAVLFRLGHVVHHGGKVGILLVNCCNPGIKHHERKALVSRLLGRNLPILLGSKKGVRRLYRWRARVFPVGVKLQRIEETIIFPTILIVSGVLAIGFFVFSFTDYYPDSLIQGLFVAFFFIVVVFFIIALFLGALVLAAHLILPVLLIALAFLAFATDILFVEPTAWIIGHPKNENLIKGLSIVVFLIGFYFDLLAS